MVINITLREMAGDFSNLKMNNKDQTSSPPLSPASSPEMSSADDLSYLDFDLLDNFSLDYDDRYSHGGP